MKAVDVFERFNQTWANTLPEKRVEQSILNRSLIPTEHLELYDGMLDSKISGIEDNPEAIVVLLVHGIQTDGGWHQSVQNQIGVLPHTNVIPLGYNVVSPLQLALPFRNTPIAKIEQEIRDARRMEKTAKFVIICHSFGSYILSKIIHKSDIDFDKIILCGSIVPIDFPWGTYTKGMKPNSIINDVGAKDFYPVMATFTTFGYGSSGRKGFQSSHIKDRYFNYGHSDFFVSENDHIEKYWKPFITDGLIVNSDYKKPSLSIFILMLCHPWIGRPAFYSLISILAYFLWLIFR